MKVGIIGAGTMGQGIAKAFAQTDGYEVMLCDIKQEWAEGGKDKIAKGYAKLVAKEKITQDAADAIVAKITPGLKEDLCADCDLIVEAAVTVIFAGIFCVAPLLISVLTALFFFFPTNARITHMIPAITNVVLS